MESNTPTCAFCGLPLDDHYEKEKIYLEDIDKSVEVIVGFRCCAESTAVFNAGEEGSGQWPVVSDR